MFGAVRPIFLASLSRRGGDDQAFPFTVPAIRTLEGLPLERPVTFFVGENGSGKSTLLEGIAAAARLPTVGSAEVQHDDTLDARAFAGGRLGGAELGLDVHRRQDNSQSAEQRKLLELGHTIRRF